MTPAPPHPRDNSLPSLLAQDDYGQDCCEVRGGSWSLRADSWSNVGHWPHKTVRSRCPAAIENPVRQNGRDTQLNQDHSVEDRVPQALRRSFPWTQEGRGLQLRDRQRCYSRRQDTTRSSTQGTARGPFYFCNRAMGDNTVRACRCRGYVGEGVKGSWHHLHWG